MGFMQPNVRPSDHNLNNHWLGCFPNQQWKKASLKPAINVKSTGGNWQSN